jgi:hypothetical protein
VPTLISGRNRANFNLWHDLCQKAREYNRSKKVMWRDSSNGWQHLLVATLLTAIAGWRGSVEISKKGKEK